MNEEELHREIVSGAFSTQVADCERNIRIQFEKLKQELTDYKERNEKIIDLLNNEYESCKGALTNPEYTIVSKHELLKNEINYIKKAIEILDKKEGK